MANRKNTFLLKRSNVINKSPLLGDLQLGEIALNTADAKLYTSYTGGLTGATEIRQIGWDRINRTGDTVTGDFNFYGNIQISGSSLPNGYAFSVTGDTNILGDVYVTGDLNYSGDLIVTGSTIVQNGLTANTIYTDYIDFNTVATVTQSQGRINWDTGTGTLNISVGDGATGLIDLQVGQEEIVRVYNAEATTLLKGEIVYVSGSQGNRPAVKRAQATSDGYSVTTLGMVDSNISSGAEGYVTIFGIISNLNTLGLTGGTPIWLSGTVPGGFTSQKPIAPLHTVLIGYVVRVSATVGSVFINISNGWELDELHDVRISAATEGDLLIRSSYSGTPVWVNSKILKGDYTFSGNTNQIGDFTITGDTTQLGNFDIAGNTFQLGNFDITGDTFQLGNTNQIGNFNITGNTSQIGNTSQVGSFRIVSATTGCTFAVTGNTCLNGDLSIVGDTFMSGDFCMNNMNSGGLPTGTNCFDTTLIPTGTTVIHQFQGEGGVLAHLNDLATGEPNSRGYTYFENNTTLTSFVAVGTGVYTPVIGAPQTVGGYNNFFTITTGATTATTNKLTYNYLPSSGSSFTYLKFIVSLSVELAQNQQLTFQIQRTRSLSTTTIPIGMSITPTGNGANGLTFNGIAEALHQDEFVLVVRNATGSGVSNSVRITDLSFSMFT